MFDYDCILMLSFYSSALVLTIDWPVGQRLYGWEMSELFGPDSPAFANHDLPFVDLFNANQTWDDIADLVKSTSLPVVLKGVLNPSAVYMAKHVGAAGIIVSNHGGK